MEDLLNQRLLDTVRHNLTYDDYDGDDYYGGLINQKRSAASKIAAVSNPYLNCLRKNKVKRVITKNVGNVSMCRAEAAKRQLLLEEARAIEKLAKAKKVIPTEKTSSRMVRSNYTYIHPPVHRTLLVSPSIIGNPGLLKARMNALEKKGFTKAQINAAVREAELARGHVKGAGYMLY